MRREGPARESPFQSRRPIGDDRAAASRTELDRRAREQRERRSSAVAAAAAVGGMASLALVLLGSPAAPTGQPGNSSVNAAVSAPLSTSVSTSGSDAAVTIPDGKLRDRGPLDRAGQ